LRKRVPVKRSRIAAAAICIAACVFAGVWVVTADLVVAVIAGVIAGPQFYELMCRRSVIGCVCWSTPRASEGVAVAGGDALIMLMVGDALQGGLDVEMGTILAMGRVSHTAGGASCSRPAV
jgi:hypothetical protein